MPTGVSGQLAGSHLTYKDWVRIHTMRDCGLSTREIASNAQIAYTTVYVAVSLHSLEIIHTNFLVAQSNNTKTYQGESSNNHNPYLMLSCELYSILCGSLSSNICGVGTLNWDYRLRVHCCLCSAQRRISSLFSSLKALSLQCCKEKAIGLVPWACSLGWNRVNTSGLDRWGRNACWWTAPYLNHSNTRRGAQN